jgi:hypothetical protein
MAHLLGMRSARYDAPATDGDRDRHPAIQPGDDHGGKELPVEGKSPSSMTCHLLASLHLTLEHHEVVHQLLNAVTRCGCELLVVGSSTAAAAPPSVSARRDSERASAAAP